MIAAIREDRLPVGLCEGVSGFHGIAVPKRKVDELIPLRGQVKAVSEDDQSSLVCAAAFGRSIGLRDHGGFLAMVAAGQIPARQAMNAKTRRPQYWVSAEDIEAFHRRFVTLTTLSSETGLHRNTVRGVLATSRVTPFAPDRQELGLVYLRAEALRALRSG